MAQSGLIVRRSTRHEIVLPAKVRVAPEHAQEIRFAKGVTNAEGWIDCDLVDFALGGAAVVTGCLLPRGAAIEMLLPESDESSPPILRVRCRVMRVQMTDRRPAYLIGFAFVSPDDQATRSIEALLDRLEGLDDGTEHTC